MNNMTRYFARSKDGTHTAFHASMEGAVTSALRGLRDTGNVYQVFEQFGYSTPRHRMDVDVTFARLIDALQAGDAIKAQVARNPKYTVIIRKGGAAYQALYALRGSGVGISPLNGLYAAIVEMWMNNDDWQAWIVLGTQEGGE